MNEREEHALRMAIEIFHRSCLKLSRHRNPNIYMRGNDELLSDWFTAGLEDLQPESLGANDHPDYIMETVGFELKSLRGRGQIQFNSTIPCGGYVHGRYEGECYYVVARYSQERQYGYLEDFSVVDGDYFNHDREWAFAHVNTQQTGFGTYADGVVRHRKMYSFPSPHREIEGVALVSKYDNAADYNGNLILERYIDREDTRGHTVRFYVYRHAALTNL
ncbi:hypothetical protein [Cytobacillus pseudoceanisediminis]|uniref:hypothetical protein n=1 Tax=Cytobacillus pseudoceanisediminis TaxID=3051614 RepID=UPI003CF94033